MRWKFACACLLIASLGKVILLGLTFGQVSPSDHGYSIKGSQQLLVTHGGLANTKTMLAWSFAFADQGYAVELMELPNHGSWYTKPMKKTQAQELWLSQANTYKPSAAIGHSLGGYVVDKLDIPLRIFIGSKRGTNSKKEQYHRGSLFPKTSTVYLLLDHVLEPWNPILIIEVLNSIGLPPSAEQKAKIWGYCLLPWVVFIFGMGMAILIAPIVVAKILKKFNSPQNDTLSALLSALLILTVFVSTTMSALWHSLIFSVFEVIIFLGCSSGAWLLNLGCRRRIPAQFSGHFSNILVWSWCIFCAFLLYSYWAVWPGRKIMGIFLALMVIVACSNFVFSRMLALPTVHAKNLCGSILYAYALAVLAPKIHYTALLG